MQLSNDGNDTNLNNDGDDVDDDNDDDGSEFFNWQRRW